MSRQINRDVGPVTWLAPGPAAGLATLQSFVETRLKDFGDKRNDPNNDCLSNLSPYLHFGQVRRPPVVVSHSNSFSSSSPLLPGCGVGQLSAQRAVLTVRAAKRHASR